MSALNAGVNKIVVPREFNIDGISYGEPKRLNTGGAVIYVNYNNGSCFLQTPMMRAPFGITTWASDSGGPDKTSIDVSFDGRETNEEMNIFFKAISDLDERILKDAFANQQLWFKKKHPTIDVLQALYTPCIRYSRDKDTGEINTRYAPNMKLNLPKDKDGELTTVAFGDKRQEINLSELIQSGNSRGARVQSIVQLSSIWIVGGKFGVSWKVKQIRICESTRLGNAFAFVPTADDDENDSLSDEAVVVRRLPNPPSALNDITNRDLQKKGKGGSNEVLSESEGEDEDQDEDGNKVDKDGLDN
jgi:hypothetical protein